MLKVTLRSTDRVSANQKELAQLTPKESSRAEERGHAAARQQRLSLPRPPQCRSLPVPQAGWASTPTG